MQRRRHRKEKKNPVKAMGEKTHANWIPHPPSPHHHFSHGLSFVAPRIKYGEQLEAKPLDLIDFAIRLHYWVRTYSTLVQYTRSVIYTRRCNAFGRVRMTAVYVDTNTYGNPCLYFEFTFALRARINVSFSRDLSHIFTWRNKKKLSVKSACPFSKPVAF